jgi:hypothetical protein
LFLYIFEDNTLGQSETEPTPDDMDCVRDGLLFVVQYENGRFKELNFGGVYKDVGKSLSEDAGVEFGTYHAVPKEN